MSPSPRGAQRLLYATAVLSVCMLLTQGCSWMMSVERHRTGTDGQRRIVSCTKTPPVVDTVTAVVAASVSAALYAQLSKKREEQEQCEGTAVCDILKPLTAFELGVYSAGGSLWGAGAITATVAAVMGWQRYGRCQERLKAQPAEAAVTTSTSEPTVSNRRTLSPFAFGAQP